MGRAKISKEYIIKTVEEKGLKFIDFIEYNGAKSIIKVICKNNHNPYEVNFSTITRNNRNAFGCPTCKSINKSKTNIDKVGYNSVKQYIKSFGYSLLTNEDEYNGISSTITVRCPSGHIFDTTFVIFRKREADNNYFINKCEFCYKDYKINLLKEKCKQNGYTLLTKKYIDRNMKLDIICDKGHEWHPTFENFMRNNAKCITCNNIQLGVNQLKDLDEVNNIVNEYEYTLLSDYTGSQNKILLRCPNGHLYSTTLGNFMQGKRCSICSMSSGEQEVYRILNKYNISSIPQHRFDDCCDISYLPFDFYLPYYNTCIEYDGQQHFNKTLFTDTDSSLQDRINKDNIKTQYCKNNNIKLIRIPYWEFNNIENILCKELNLK